MRIAALCAAVGAVVVLAAAGSAHGATADTITSSPFTFGNATFSNFTYTSATVPANTVDVAFAADGSMVTFTRTNGAVWNTVQNNSVITYDVTFTLPVVQTQLDFVGSATGDGTAFVGETVKIGGTNFPLQVITGFGPTVSTAVLDINPAAFTLHVTKSIDVAANTGTATITSADNVYLFGGGRSVSPEPASLAMLSLPMVLLMRRRRSL
jgi:hypothetical protein